MAKERTKKIYLWEAINQRGETVKGEFTGASLALAKSSLRSQGLTIKKIQKKTKPLFGSGRSKKIKSLDIMVFSRQLSTMLSSGIPLLQSFDIVAKGASNPKMYALIMSIKTNIEKGGTLFQALKKHPDHFSDLFCHLVNAGEKSGSLDVMLNRVATYQERTESIKGKVKKALIYPISVLSVAFFVTLILMIFVVPQFESLFKGFGATLPAPTQFVITASEFCQAYWWLMLGGIFATIISVRWLIKNSTSAAYQKDKMLLKIPVIGLILKNAIIARFARTLGIIFASGLPLVEALTTVAGATGNLLYYQGTLQIRDNVATGKRLQEAMQQTQLFPNMVLQMIGISEESGSLEAMLDKVASFYEERVDESIDNLSSLLEPVILVFLAGIIGGLVVSMYLPIFKLGSIV